MSPMHRKLKEYDSIVFPADRVTSVAGNEKIRTIELVPMYRSDDMLLLSRSRYFLMTTIQIDKFIEIFQEC